MSDGQNNQRTGPRNGPDSRRRRPAQRRNNNGGNGGQRPQNGSNSENRNRDYQQGNRYRRNSGRVLTTSQVLVKYDNLLEHHLVTRRKYYEYYNRVDDRQLQKLERSFFESIEHLRRFEANLEPWQREALEKRKTERYRLDLTYSINRNLDPTQPAEVEVKADEIEDPHFKETQKGAFEEYKDDREESVGTFEDYLKLKGLN